MTNKETPRYVEKADQDANSPEEKSRKPQTWAEVEESVCRWDSCEPCVYNGGHSRTHGGFECTHPLRPKGVESNPIISQLKKELAEARECELTAKGLGYPDSVIKWVGYQEALWRAIKIVEKGK